MKRDLLATAYHAAGHAVIAWEAQRRFTRVTIAPDEEAGTLGTCRYESLPDDFAPDLGTSRQDELLIRDMIVSAFAGHAAEAVYFEERGVRRRNNFVGSDRDRTSAGELALYVTGSEEEARAYLSWLWIRVQMTVRTPPCWSAITALATALLQRQTLTYDEAAPIIKTAYQGSAL
jgi:hypothetical protein